jgi:hypothetical protein
MNDEKKRKKRRKFTYHSPACMHASDKACVRYLSKNVP